MNEKKLSDSSGDRQEIDINYRPFNALALVAMALAVLGLFTLMNMIFVFFPVVAAVLAIVAVSMGGDGKVLTGGRIAKAALFLAVFTLAFAVAKNYFRDAYLNRVAYGHSQVFMQKFYENRYGEQFGFTEDPRTRQVTGTDLNEYYQSKATTPRGNPAFVELQVWLSLVPWAQIREDDFAGELEFLRYAGTRRDLRNDHVDLDFRYTPANASIKSVEFRVTFTRSRYSEPMFVQWRVQPLKILKGPEQQDMMSVQMPKGGDPKK